MVMDRGIMVYFLLVKMIEFMVQPDSDYDDVFNYFGENICLESSITNFDFLCVV